MPEVGRAVVGLAERRSRDAGQVRDGRRDRRPAEAGGALVGLGERAARSGRRPRSAARRGSGPRGSRRGGAVFSEVRVVAATRSATSLQRRMAAMVYRHPPMAHRSWFPESLDGRSDRPPAPRARRTSRAFRRWYADPEVARLTRYQDGPMRPDEIERFFAARALGAGLARDGDPRRATTDRLIGTCAFASSTATTARRCSTSRSARRMPGATATAPRRPG